VRSTFGLGQLQETIGLQTGIAVGFLMVVPAALIALFVLLRHPEVAGNEPVLCLRHVCLPRQQTVATASVRSDFERSFGLVERHLYLERISKRLTAAGLAARRG
jgi:hypothetical protein